MVQLSAEGMDVGLLLIPTQQRDSKALSLLLSYLKFFDLLNAFWVLSLYRKMKMNRCYIEIKLAED